jgi:hypothetical protein
VRFPYLAVPTKTPVPSLGGARARHRPVIAVALTGPTLSKLRDGLLDTGADDTIFSEALAALLGVDLRQAEERFVSLASRPQPIRCRYSRVELRITDGVQETYEWPAVVGFVPGPLHYNLLGQAGFLQFFNAEFDGEAHHVTLTLKPSFPGRKV